MVTKMTMRTMAKISETTTSENLMKKAMVNSKISRIRAKAKTLRQLRQLKR